MGTLGCINDMLQRDKENRELRKIGRERLKDTRNRLIGLTKGSQLPATSVEDLELIKQKTTEKEELDRIHLFRTQFLLVAGVLLAIFLGWLLYSLF